MRRLRMISIAICVIFVAQILAGCAAFTKYGGLEKKARQYYQRGDYDLAVFRCAESLRLNPNYEKAQVLIKDVFRAAVNARQGNIEELQASSAEFRWDNIAAQYEALIKLNQAVESLPTLRVKKTGEVIRFELTDYCQNLREAKANAAEAHYQVGLRLSKRGGIDIQKQAAKEFKTALSFLFGYKDASERYEKCRREAIQRMAISPFEDKSGKGGKYGAISEMITDQIIANVMGASTATEFLELVSREELETVLEEQKLQLSDLVDRQTAAKLGKFLGVHGILLGKITQIIYTPPRTTTKVLKRQTEVSVKVGEEYRTRTVSASVKVYTRPSKASIIGSYKIIDVQTARLRDAASFDGKADFQRQWATYSGDKRALKSEDDRLIAKGEQLAPSEEELVLEAARNLGNSLGEDLKAYVR